jgi:hypothetical protein
MLTRTHARPHETTGCLMRLVAESIPPFRLAVHFQSLAPFPAASKEQEATVQNGAALSHGQQHH